MDDHSNGEVSGSSSSIGLKTRLWRKYQHYLDLVSPHKTPRWAVALVYLLLYGIRAVTAGGWYIITYALGIYYLNLLLSFLSPKIDPSYGMEDDDEDSEGPQLPMNSTEEFRPFIRRLPEFKFWHRVMIGTTVAFACTCFKFLDVPVYWPVLAMYFVVLFVLTMKKQILHMIKYKYLPFSYGKRRYRGKEDSGSVVSN